jgi:hypothetical protein
MQSSKEPLPKIIGQTDQDLLEALEAIVAFDTPLPCGLLKQARAAIAKAKGGAE